MTLAASGQPTEIEFEWRESAREGMTQAGFNALAYHTARVRLLPDAVTSFNGVVSALP